MDREIVKYIANLSNISLSSNEEQSLAKELARIVEYISKINEVSQDLKRADLEERQTHLRDDEIKTSISLSSFKKLSSYIEDNQFKVPKVIE